MSDLLQSLKTEITRLSRKEIKAAIEPIQSSNIRLKKTVAELKDRISQLESQNRQLSKSTKSIQTLLPETSTDTPERVRITAKTLFKLRSKFDMSREAFAKLMGVSSQNIYALENKTGTLKLRSATMAKYLSIRDLGKKEALKRLADLDGK